MIKFSKFTLNIKIYGSLLNKKLALSLFLMQKHVTKKLPLFFLLLFFF